MGVNQIEEPISRRQSKKLKKKLLVPIGKNQDIAQPETLNDNTQITYFLFSALFQLPKNER